ncbi:MAG TPA: 30S ribosomal protein S4 [Patescibacteria group bacterium]|nr:30S ribosomal protein S4 [Patescibacteria group bacterium]
MRYTGPKNRLARREGVDLGLKTPGTKSHSNLLKRLALVPGQHGVSRRRTKMTDYAVQLREKQKLKRIYGVSEKQMKNYFKKASKKVGNTAEYIIQYLEKRLDNVVYRLNFAPTRAAARQLVGHGHIAVNKRKINIASYEVKVGETIGFMKEKTWNMPMVVSMVEKKELIVPSFISKNEKDGSLIADPQKAHMPDIVDTQMVVEFYSR